MVIGLICRGTSIWKWPKTRSASMPPGSALILTAQTAACGPSEFRAGLPTDRRQRRVNVDRSRGHDDVTAQIPYDKSLYRGLSPAVSGEESKRVLRVRGLRSSLQTRGVTGGGRRRKSCLTLFPL